MSGFFTSKQKTKSNSKARVHLDPWVEDPLQDLMQRAWDLSQEGFQQYGGERLAPLTSEELEAHQRLKDISGSHLGAFQNLDDVLSRTQNVGLGGFNQSDLQPFMNPLIENVLDIQKRRALEDFQTQMTQQRGLAGQGGAFGGSRFGAQEALMRRNFNQEQGDREILGLSDAFNFGMENMFRGMDMAGTSALQRAQGALQNRDTSIKDISNLQGIGEALRDFDQRGLDIGYQDWLTQKEFPYKQLGFLSQVGLPIGQLTAGSNQNSTSTTRNTPSPFQMVADVAGLAMGIGGGLSGMFGGGGNLGTAGNLGAHQSLVSRGAPMTTLGSGENIAWSGPRITGGMTGARKDGGSIPKVSKLQEKNKELLERLRLLDSQLSDLGTLSESKPESDLESLFRKYRADPDMLQESKPESKPGVTGPKPWSSEGYPKPGLKDRFSDVLKNPGMENLISSGYDTLDPIMKDLGANPEKILGLALTANPAIRSVGGILKGAKPVAGVLGKIAKSPLAQALVGLGLINADEIEDFVGGLSLPESGINPGIDSEINPGINPGSALGVEDFFGAEVPRIKLSDLEGSGIASGPSPLPPPGFFPDFGENSGISDFGGIPDFESSSGISGINPESLMRFLNQGSQGNQGNLSQYKRPLSERMDNFWTRFGGNILANSTLGGAGLGKGLLAALDHDMVKRKSLADIAQTELAPTMDMIKSMQEQAKIRQQENRNAMEQARLELAQRRSPYEEEILKMRASGESPPVSDSDILMKLVGIGIPPSMAGSYLNEYQRLLNPQ